MEFLGAIWWIPGWNGRASGSERAVRALVGSPSRAPQGGNYIKAAARGRPTAGANGSGTDPDHWPARAHREPSRCPTSTWSTSERVSPTRKSYY